MGHDKLVRYKHEGDKLLKITYNPYIGVCPKCGDGGLKSPREVTHPRIMIGEEVQRFSCNACDYSGTGDKFGLSREPITPLKVEIIEGTGVCPACGAEHVSFPNGSQRYYAFTFGKYVDYTYLKCRECEYRGTIEKFGVEE